MVWYHSTICFCKVIGNTILPCLQNSWRTFPPPWKEVMVYILRFCRAKFITCLSLCCSIWIVLNFRGYISFGNGSAAYTLLPHETVFTNFVLKNNQPLGMPNATCMSFWIFHMYSLEWTQLHSLANIRLDLLIEEWQTAKRILAFVVELIPFS